MNRKPLFSVGLKGSTVHGFAQTLKSGAKVVTVEWREGGRKSQSWPMTAEGKRLARAHAEGTSQRLQSRGIPTLERLKIGELFIRFVRANEHQWRETTRIGAVQRWRIFAGIVGEQTFADLVTPETLDEVRERLRSVKRPKTGRPTAPNQIRETLARVCGIWRWAKRRKLLADNPLAGYENGLGRDEGALEVPEYTPEEFTKLMAQLSPDHATGWRAYCVIALAGLLGKRERTLLELTWSTIDEEAGVFRWPKATDKTGKEWTQPMPDDARAVIAVMRRWREKIGYTGPYAFPPARSHSKMPHYTADAVIKALHTAERRAGVEVIQYRALHSLKRMVVRSLHDLLGGDLLRVGAYVGNSSVKILRKHYLRGREGDLDRAAASMKLPQRNTEPAP